MLHHCNKTIFKIKYTFSESQYNPEKSKPGWRRPCQDIRRVSAPFDAGQFNFNLVDGREVLLDDEELTGGRHADTFVAINASPLEFGSSLLVPNATSNIPQMATLDGLELLLELVMRSTDR